MLAVQGAGASMSPAPSVICIYLLFAISGYIALLEGARAVVVLLAMMRGKGKRILAARKISPTAPRARGMRSADGGPEERRAGRPGRRLGF